MKKLRVYYKNSDFELFFLLILWCIGWILIIAIPCVINSMIGYFSKGFVVYEEAGDEA